MVRVVLLKAAFVFFLCIVAWARNTRVRTRGIRTAVAMATTAGRWTRLTTSQMAACSYVCRCSIFAMCSHSALFRGTHPVGRWRPAHVCAVSIAVDVYIPVCVFMPVASYDIDGPECTDFGWTVHAKWMRCGARIWGGWRGAECTVERSLRGPLLGARVGLREVATLQFKDVAVLLKGELPRQVARELRCPLRASCRDARFS